MGLLTKIFGSPEGGVSAGEPASATPAASPASEAALPALPAYTKGEHGNSGIRPAVDPPTQRPREAARPSAPNRRPEHPRMYLRATPAAIDPTLPGSTRRQQISVRPAGKDALSRAPAPPSKRGLERGASRAAAEEANRREPKTEPAPPGLRLPRARPRPAMVVSPVSLTPEQLALPPGGRQKMPTLLGLGAAVSEILALDMHGSAAADAAPSSGVASRGSRSTGEWSESAPELDGAARLEDTARLEETSAYEEASPVVDTAEAVGPSVALLADFALKLSLGPISGTWAPQVRSAVSALLPVAKERQQATLGAVLGRLIELLPSDASSALATLDGALRDQLVHEVTRLAGLLPEWPAPAQDLAEEARRREIRVVRELLLSIDGTRRDQRARLEQQVRLEVLGGMTAQALAQELGAPVERGTELRRVLDAYLGERQASEPDLGNRLGLARALERLEDAARAFDDADPELKDVQRALRGARRDAMTAVQLLVAERGEHEWLDLLEPLSVGERIERLKQWLRAAADDAGVEGPSSG